VEDRFL
jgi:hypothetical protein